jgi:O-antigen/teichoic acid export membrane protein
MLEKIRRQFIEGKTLVQFGFFKALGLITPLIIARFFSEDLFGTYSLAIPVVFCFMAMLITPPQTPLVVFASKERTETGKINKSFSIQCVLFVFAIFLYTVIALIFNRRICTFIGVTPTDFICISAGFIGVALSSLVVNLFLAMNQRVKSSLAEFAFGAINLGLVVTLCFAHKLNIRTVFGAYLVSAIVVIGLFIWTIDFSALLPFRLESGKFRETFNFTKWIFIGATATSFIDWGDNIILKIFHLPMADIGQYGLAYRIFNGVVTLIYILNSYFLPFISQNLNDQTRMRDYLFRKRPQLFFLGLVVLAAGFILCPIFFKIVYPDSYKESVIILRILLVGCVFVLYNTFYIPLLNALKVYKFAQTAAVIVMLFKVCTNVPLVIKYGLYGAAAGTVISYLFMTLIYEFYYRVKMKKMLLTKSA